jgi:predicted CopG family antitoxin
MPYKKLIKIAPDVDHELCRLKREWELQSHNKVLRRLLKLTPQPAKDGADAHS